MTQKPVIGRIEIVDLPELGLYGIQAKIDTGAATSVLHCAHFDIFEKEGHRYIRCALNEHPETKQGKWNTITFPIHRERVVKSSFGQAELRHIFITKIKLFDTLFDIKLSVRDRSNMSYPMLLGRNFICNKFLVDVSQKYLAKSTS